MAENIELFDEHTCFNRSEYPMKEMDQKNKPKEKCFYEICKNSEFIKTDCCNIPVCEFHCYTHEDPCPFRTSQNTTTDITSSRCYTDECFDQCEYETPCCNRFLCKNHGEKEIKQCSICEDQYYTCTKCFEGVICDICERRVCIYHSDIEENMCDCYI